MKIPDGKGALLDLSGIPDNVVAVNVIHALDKNQTKLLKDDEAYRIECTQCAWPLNDLAKEIIQNALDRGEEVVVLAYRTITGEEMQALGLADKDCDISERRIIEAVFTLEPVDGMSRSNYTYGKVHPKPRTKFTLIVGTDKLKDKYLKNRLPIPAYRAGLPQLLGRLASKEWQKEARKSLKRKKSQPKKHLA